MKNIALITNTSGCTVVIGTDVHTVANDHPNFVAIQDAYAAGDVDQLESLVSIRKTIESFGEGVVRIEKGQLYYGDRLMTNGLARRIIMLMNEGREGFAKPLVAFMENVMLNPSYRAVDGLYEWLEKSKLPITPRGTFIAWKIVRSDYKDIRTGKFDNSPGKVVEIARNEVDENPDRTCSSGLHFCSNEYLPHYGGMSGGNKIVMVEVNPRDVGAFPGDYNISKGRCSRYEVIGEVTFAETETKFAGLKSGVYRPETDKTSTKFVSLAKAKTVARLDTKGDRAEVTLIFSDGTKQRTTHRLGNTISFDQTGNTVTLQPSGRIITIK